MIYLLVSRVFQFLCFAIILIVVIEYVYVCIYIYNLDKFLDYGDATPRHHWTDVLSVFGGIIPKWYENSYDPVDDHSQKGQSVHNL